ncbi:MAG: serine/threonine protein kinase, partial [Nannocystaceae bacterium]|nr:serine/threonine protein kinase [Nannocystaceae bacterium]
MSECLSENEIVDFVMRNLEPEEAGQAEAHVDTCSACRAVLIELARVFELRASSVPEPQEVSQDDTEASEPLGLGLLPPEMLRGSKVGRYVMLDLLGTGAMGVVFSAYDPELDRRVALKLLRERTGDEDRNARMVREARATARLAHPNVVVVHDVGEFEGNVFMAMELVVGGTLSQWLRASERSRDAILDVFLEAGQGLVAAHAAGLVHRDFKPVNVLMGDDDRARVTDFGLARAGETLDTHTHTHTHRDVATLSGSGDVAVTKTGALVGTPAYVSPEQFEGRVADAQSDQFSYCVALAEALTGERPFEGRTLAELQTTVCSGTLRPLALDALPRKLQAALSRGLSVDPRQRFSDMG